MPFSLAIRPEAEADIAEAFEYYESIRAGLSADFLLCLEEVFSRVTRNPKQFQLIYKSVSRAFLRRFPYAVFFIIRDSHVIVLAVMHVRRNPARWPSVK